MTNKKDTVFLENCEGFEFVLGEPAYCSDCGKGIAYDIKNGKAIFPNKCSHCKKTIVKSIH